MNKIIKILIIIGFYLAIASMVYRFKHPEMTETQLFLNIPKAITLNYE